MHNLWDSRKSITRWISKTTKICQNFWIKSNSWRNELMLQKSISLSISEQLFASWWNWHMTKNIVRWYRFESSCRISRTRKRESCSWKNIVNKSTWKKISTSSKQRNSKTTKRARDRFARIAINHILIYAEILIQNRFSNDSKKKKKWEKTQRNKINTLNDKIKKIKSHTLIYTNFESDIDENYDFESNESIDCRFR